MRRALVTAALVSLSFALAACRKDAEPPPVVETPQGEPEPTGPCLKWNAQAQRVGSVPEQLEELSGLVASRRLPGILWAHNDSGHAAELFALRETGEIVARFLFEGVTPADVEDVATGPCIGDPSRTCVFLADIGDNLKRRANVQLLEVDEPAELPAASEPVTLTARTYRFRYADGPVDAESLVIDPVTGTPHVITKVWESLGDVHRLRGLGDEEITAERVGTLTAPGDARWATAADVSPDGSRLLVRSYGGVWELRGGSGAQTIETLLQRPALPVTSASQPQSEAIAYLPEGRAYLLGTEGVGEGLFRVDCRD